VLSFYGSGSEAARTWPAENFARFGLFQFPGHCNFQKATLTVKKLWCEHLGLLRLHIQKVLKSAAKCGSYDHPQVDVVFDEIKKKNGLWQI
jgi:hypothetical protein